MPMPSRRAEGATTTRWANTRAGLILWCRRLTGRQRVSYGSGRRVGVKASGELYIHGDYDNATWYSMTYMTDFVTG